MDVLAKENHDLLKELERERMEKKEALEALSKERREREAALAELAMARSRSELEARGSFQPAFVAPYTPPFAPVAKPDESIANRDEAIK